MSVSVTNFDSIFLYIEGTGGDEADLVIAGGDGGGSGEQDLTSEGGDGETVLLKSGRIEFETFMEIVPMDHKLDLYATDE